jgi:hypothetical protein
MLFSFLSSLFPFFSLLQPFPLLFFPLLIYKIGATYFMGHVPNGRSPLKKKETAQSFG